MPDNGLTAAAYTSLGRIDPLVIEPVLAALAEAGIAAYTGRPDKPEEAAPEPADGPPAGAEPDGTEGRPVVRTEEPTEPAEREVPAGREEIFVDSEQVDKARPVIARSTEDAEWKSLVEQFNAPSAAGHEPPVPRWPASEDVDANSYEPLIDVPAGMDRVEEEPEPAPVKRRDDDPHDHFVPPEPPRGPKLDWISRLAWFGLIGGPLLLLVAAIFDLGLGRLAALAVAGFVGGFLTLVVRMKDRLPQDDTPDDGAVV